MNLIDILNQYIELYNKALNIQGCIFIINLGQYNREDNPIIIEEIMMLCKDFTNLYHNIGGWLIDSLIGDSPTKEVVENRIRVINIKLNGLGCGKLFEEYNENGSRGSIIHTSVLMKYYNQEDANTIKILLQNIDACISLVNGFIKQSVEQAQREYLRNEADTEESTEGLRLPQELDTERARMYFARAIERGWMEFTSTGFKWTWGGDRGAKARLAYFLVKVYCLSITDTIQADKCRLLEQLFEVVRIDRTIQQNDDTGKSTMVKKWRTAIDELFD